MVSSDEALKMMKAAKWEDAPNSLKILLKDIKNDILSKDKCTLSWHLAGKPQTLINRSKILNSLDEFKENVSKGYITGYTALGPHTWFNEWRYIFQLSVEKQYEICLEMSKWLGGGWELRGCFGIPPGGFLGWHTNANALMPRMYFVWNDSNTSQFYVDTDKGIKVIKESKGWRRNVFAPPAWHSGRTDGFRFSMGFRPSAMWTYMNKKDLKYLLKGTALLSDAPNGSCCKNNDCEAINDYKVGNKRYKVNMIDLEPLIDKKLLKRVKIKDIAYIGFNCSQIFCECCGNERVDNASSEYPVILVEGMNNFGKKYRSLDGKHRILQRIHKDKEDIECFVLDEKKVFKLLKEI